MNKFKPHVLAVLIFVAISAIYFSPVFKGEVLSAHDVDTWRGMSKEVVDYREETGKESLWTKRMFSGMPAYQISTRSNGNLIQYIDKLFQIGLPRPMNMLFMYLIGFYILLLTLKIDFKLSILGAIAFAFSSYFIIILQAGHMTKAHAIAYMPLIIASVLYTLRNEKWLIGATFTSLFVALQLYSNHYQITYYTLIILFFIGIVQLVKEFHRKELPIFLKKIGILIIAALLGGATNYTRLSTTMEYAPDTQRGKSELTLKEGEKGSDGLGLEYATRWSYGKSETMTFLIPNFMGGSSGESVLDDRDSKTLKYLRSIKSNKKREKMRQQSFSYWGEQPGTSPTYVGAIIFFLFVLGITYVKSSFRIWILITVVLSIMLAWGSNFMSLTEFFFNYIPAYNKFRAVTMVMVIAQFGIALLAILALNKLLNKEDSEEKTNKLKLAFFITGGITLVFALVPSLFLDFLSSKEILNDNLNFTSKLAEDRSSILKADAWRSFLFIFLAAGTLWMFIKEKIKKQYVVITLSLLVLIDMWSVDKRYLNESHFVKENNSSIKRTSADDVILKNNPNQFRVFDLSDSRNGPFNSSRASYFHNSIGGYHAAKLMRYQDLIDNHLSQNNTSVLSMLNCGWIITAQGEAVQSEQAGLTPLGNAWFISSVLSVENADEEIQALNNFNPATTAIIDKRFDNILQGRKNFDNEIGSKIELDIKNYKPNHLTYTFTSPLSSDQLAVFSEIYYDKGWNAYLDGELSSYFRANYVLRAMIVPSGTKKIEFKFNPSSYHTGEAVAYTSSILLLLLLGFVSYKHLKRL